MFTKEQLIAKGIEEETVTKILSTMNTLLKEELDNNYVSKDSFNKVNEKKNELQLEKDTLSSEVTRLKSFEDKVNTLTTKLTNLETEHSALQEKFTNQAIVLANENIVKNILSEQVIDLDDVFPKIDMNKVVIKNGKVESGLEEQIKTIKEAKPHYFKTTDETNKQNQFFGFPPQNSSSNSNNTDTSDVLFAKALAGDLVKMNESMKKAEDVYFKGGIDNWQ